MSHPLQKVDIFADQFVITLPPVYPHLFQDGSLSVEVLLFNERLCTEDLGKNYTIRLLPGDQKQIYSQNSTKAHTRLLNLSEDIRMYYL